jgi:hypothetical protein
VTDRDKQVTKGSLVQWLWQEPGQSKGSVTTEKRTFVSQSRLSFLRLQKINEWWIGKDIEEICRGLFKVVSQNFWRDRVKPSKPSVPLGGLWPRFEQGNHQSDIHLAATFDAKVNVYIIDIYRFQRPYLFIWLCVRLVNVVSGLEKFGLCAVCVLPQLVQSV